MLYYSIIILQYASLIHNRVILSNNAGWSLFGQGLPRWLSGKESTCDVGDAGLILESGRSPGEGNGNPLEYSCLGNPTERGAWSCKESDTTEQLNHHHHILDKSRYMNT